MLTSDVEASTVVRARAIGERDALLVAGPTQLEIVL